MPPASPNARSPSILQRIWDAILTLFCRPTRPPSPPQATLDTPSGLDTQPDSPLKSTPSMLLVEDAQALPKDLSVEGGLTENLTCSSSESLEDVAKSAQGTVTVLDPPLISPTTITQGPNAGLPSSTSSTPQPSPTLAPACDASIDGEMKSHLEPILSLDTSPNDLHNHTPDIEQEPHAGPSTVVSNIAPSTPTVPDVGLQPSIAVQGLSGDGETQRQLYLTDIVITLSNESAQPVYLAELCVLGVGGAQEGKCIRLIKDSLRMWTTSERIMLPLRACEVYCIAKDEAGNDVAFIQLKQEGVHTMGGGQFVTHNSDLILSMSWKIAHDVTLPPEGVPYSVEGVTGMDFMIGAMIDNPEIDPAVVSGLLDGLMSVEESATIGSFQDYINEALQARRRYESTGNLNDINDIIGALEHAIELTPDGHTNLPALLGDLGVSFWIRFERSGDMPDINQAITTQQRAVQLTPQGHADLPSRLSNLGSSLARRFERIGEMADITQAISNQQRAVQLTPQGHADLPSMLNNLGNSFIRRFERTGEMADITQAITNQQRAVQLSPQGHADLPSWLNNLGSSFTCRFERTGEMADITQAISNKQRAVQLTPQGHADLPIQLSNLGKSFRSRFEHAKANCNSTEKRMCLEDLHSSVECFTAATRDISGSPTLRLKCAVQWAHLLMRHDPLSSEVLVPFEAAVNLLSLVAGLEWTLQSRHNQLQGASGITLEAAAAACSLGYPGKAVEWLEQGRCLVWGQLNGLRTPMDALHEQHPQLADHLGGIAKRLELAGSSRAAVDPSMDISVKIPLEEEAKAHLALAREWEESLSAARKLPGFESFLLPSPCSALLQGLPESGPIVVINCHKGQCDALALLHGLDQPLHIPLLDFSFQKAVVYRWLLKKGLSSNGFRMRQEVGSSEQSLNGIHERAAVQDPDEDEEFDIQVNTMLQCLWLEVAKPILDMLGYSKCDKSSTPPRIWWCPTGVMSFLPIHAAGIYSGTNPECVMDYVVSSYTPTISAVTDRMKRSPVDIPTSGLFLTSHPRAPGAAVITGTTKEVDAVHAKAMETGTRVLNRGGDDISVEDCRKYMEEFSSVHLACHASQNASDPLKSRFLLHKGELTLLSIIQMNLKNADLAFLSACQTSAGEEKLSDEAVHLAAGMLAAGYRRVIATMWSINDAHAPRVATDFYDYLWKKRADETGDGGFDGSLSAHALHHAIQELRARLGNSERDLLTWVPYVHFGY